MKFIENHTKIKSEAKKEYLSYFKTQDVEHLVTHKLKNKMSGKSTSCIMVFCWIVTKD